MADEADEGQQIVVRFTPKQGVDEKYKVPDDQLAIPAHLTRLGLSQIINGLLELEPPKPFDFLVGSTLVREPLQDLVTALNISAELVLDIKYGPAVLPPKLKETVPHDDWISSVCAITGGGIFTGSYDGMARIWSGGGDAAGSFAAHRGRITAVVPLPQEQGERLLVTSGQDGAARLWRLTEEAAAAAAAGDRDGSPAEPSSGSAAAEVAEYRGHSDSVAALSAAPDGARFASGGWDGAVHLWDTGAATVEAAGEAAAEGAAGAAKKRRSGAGGQVADAPAVLQVNQSAQLLSGHRQCVSGVAWPSEERLVTGSWDRSVRVWDVATGVNHSTLNHSKAVHCVASAPAGGATVAFGGAEADLRLWDPRSQNDDLGVKALASHSDWIAAVAWHPTSEYHLVTASHDASLRLWDLRAAVPLHTLGGHTEKVLCAGWLDAGRVASGGADNELRIHAVPLQF